MLGLVESRLRRTETLELRLRLALCSPGSAGCKPADFPNMLRTSVSDMTPLSFPDRRAPGMAAAGADDPLADGWGPIIGVTGTDGDGDTGSTIHMRCDLVAVSLPTTWASVDRGVT